MSRLVFVDTETTGLDPERHEAWEVATVTEDGEEAVYFLKPDLATADPTALRINGFYQRRPWTSSPFKEPHWSDPRLAAEFLAKRLAGAHMVGAVPSFDAAFLDRFLRRHGQAPAWHYHLVDVEALAAGAKGLAPPWDSEKLSRGVGVEPTTFARHTALGDAKWARAIYLAVMEGP